MLCSADGYPHQTSIYCGKSDSPDDVSLDQHVVLSFAALVDNKAQHELYFENFFTSHALLCTHRDQGLRATGKIRDGRLRGASFSKKAFKKKEQGTYEYASDGNLCTVRWSDNNLVTCASNLDSVNPVKKVKRRMKGKSEKVPCLTATYDCELHQWNGRCRSDGSVATSLPTKDKREEVVVEFLCQCFEHCSCCNLETKLQCGTHIRCINTFGFSARSCAWTSMWCMLCSPLAPVPECIRFDKVEHYLKFVTQGRCALCNTNTRKMCGNCGKRLHKLCFQTFHTQ